MSPSGIEAICQGGRYHGAERSRPTSQPRPPAGDEVVGTVAQGTRAEAQSRRHTTPPAADPPQDVNDAIGATEEISIECLHHKSIELLPGVGLRVDHGPVGLPLQGCVPEAHLPGPVVPQNKEHTVVTEAACTVVKDPFTSILRGHTLHSRSPEDSSP